jgi:hypothetical protein
MNKLKLDFKTGSLKIQDLKIIKIEVFIKVLLMIAICTPYTQEHC